MTKLPSSVVILVFAAFFVVSDCQLGCRDENNNFVDWYYIYKLPKNKFTNNKLIKDGVAYLYVTPNTIKKGWTLSRVSINSTDSMPENTLSPIYKNSNNLLSVIYNDQPPEYGSKEPKAPPGSKTSAKSTVQPEKKPGLLAKIYSYFKGGRKTREVHMKETFDSRTKAKARLRTTGGGHTKGVVVSDANSGFWLVHSVPKYPPLPNKAAEYSYPETATKFGQSYLCISLSGNEINKVGEQLIYNEPNIIFNNVPSSMRSAFNNIVDVVNRKTIKSPPWSHIANLTSVGNVRFISFAKSARFNDDIYESLVAPTFDTDLLVETWRNGPGALESECKLKHKVKNIKKIAFHNISVAFSSHSDHSKWAVSVLKDSSNCKVTCSRDRWICIGDINRAEAQETRGGGTVCTKNVYLWTMYSQSINEVENCSDKPDEYNFGSSSVLG